MHVTSFFLIIVSLLQSINAILSILQESLAKVRDSKKLFFILLFELFLSRHKDTKKVALL